MIRISKWQVMGLVPLAIIVYSGFVSHGNFKKSLVENFNVQQGLFAKSMENSIRNNIYEKQTHILHVVREIKRSEEGIVRPFAYLPTLIDNHLDSFDAFGLFDHQGSRLFLTSRDYMQSPEHVSLIEETIFDNREEYAPFMSGRFGYGEGGVGIFLFVPFKMPDSPLVTYYAVGAFSIEDYLLTYFPGWKGKTMGFVLADSNGDILSMMNTEHEISAKMKTGNMIGLSQDCLACHKENDFADVREAVKSDELVFSTYTLPGSTGTINRVTHAFSIYNRTWLISVFSPFESIQKAIDANDRLNLLLIASTMFLVGVMAYAFQRSLRLEEIAQTAEDLRRSRESLRQYARELEEANHFKDFFTDIVRHDLMSPVAVVKGYTDILASGESDPSRQEIFSAVSRSLRKLTEIIQNSATISKLEGEKDFELTSGDLVEIIDSSIGNSAEMMRERKIGLIRSMDGGCPVKVSPLLENVFHNLISNAVKFSPEGKKIEVGIEDGGDRWDAIVKDWGEGIKDENKEKIFSRFERLGKEGIKGSGLGLTIVRRIVDLHNGTVTVSDNPEGGSIFTVSLPKDDSWPGKG
jgi:signal transduction histidine kinase